MDDAPIASRRPPPLEGLRVLDLSRVLAGPWCTMTLGDLGADVIKVEPPGGDDTRALGPPFRGDLSAYFACCNRNKRSIALDLGDPQARTLLDGLLREADVLVENFRADRVEALGLSPRHTSALNPRLVHCSITGYGHHGRDAARPGYDYIAQAEAGLMAVTGPVDGPPSKVGVAVADLLTGLNATIAILAALRERDRSGRGQHLDLALFDSQLQGLANVGAGALFDAPTKRHGNAHPNIVPYQTFAAADGSLVVAVASAKLWGAFCDAIGRPELRGDARFADNAARVRNRDALVALLEPLFAGRSRDEWITRLRAADVPCAPVQQVPEAIDQAWHSGRDLLFELAGVPQIASPLRLSASPVRYGRAPPVLDADGPEIRAALRNGVPWP